MLQTGKLTDEQMAELEQEKQLKLKTMMDNNAFEISQKLVQLTSKFCNEEEVPPHTLNLQVLESKDFSKNELDKISDQINIQHSFLHNQIEFIKNQQKTLMSQG